MWEASSRASAASTLGSSEPECESSSSAKLTRGAEESSPSTGPESPALTMFEESMQRAYNWHLSEPQKQTAAAMYRTGMSLGQIAKHFGVSRQSMHDVLKRRTPMRDRLEALPRKPKTALRAKRNTSLKRYRSRAARITRAQILEVKTRDRTCVKCGAAGTDIDHILPVSRGGQTTLENLQLLCNPCHRVKSGAELRKEVR